MKYGIHWQQTLGVSSFLHKPRLRKGLVNNISRNVTLRVPLNLKSSSLKGFLLKTKKNHFRSFRCFTESRLVSSKTNRSTLLAKTRVEKEVSSAPHFLFRPKMRPRRPACGLKRSVRKYDS